MKTLRKHRNYIVILVLTIIMSVIFLNSLYWPYEGFSIRKLLSVGIVVFLVVCMPVLAVKIKCVNRTVGQWIDSFVSVCKQIVINWKKSVFCVAVYVIVTLICILINYCINSSASDIGYRYRLYFILTIAYIGVTLYFVRRVAAKKPELIFAIIVMLIGTFFIRVTPGKVGTSWDDQIHYLRALNLSNFVNGIMYEADITAAITYVNGEYTYIYFEEESREAYVNEIEGMYADKIISSQPLNWHSYYSISLLQTGLGIMIGRGLGLSWTGVFMLGKFFNLLIYTLIFIAAIRRIRYGKMLIACIGLIPTSVYMACSYSYDLWVVSMTVLGFSYLFGVLQDKDEQMKTRDMIIMVTAILFGCLPKAIYFVLLLPFLFIPKNKFKNRKQQRGLHIYVIMSGLLLAATFMLPMIISGPGTGDSRGGAGVNSTGQVDFILNNPLQYAEILFDFIKGYISLDNAVGYTQKYGYFGDGKYYTLVIAIILIMALWNKGEAKEHIPVIRCAGLIAVVGVLILVPTALYISFTPVAHETVLGCQYRYLLPVIFPTLYLVCGTGNQRELQKAREVILPMILIAMTFMANINTIFVSAY